MLTQKSKSNATCTVDRVPMRPLGYLSASLNACTNVFPRKAAICGKKGASTRYVALARPRIRATFAPHTPSSWQEAGEPGTQSAGANRAHSRT
jgi:hypothetical protein